jgi:hypothetical protein
VIDAGTISASASKLCAITTSTPVFVPIAPTTGGLPTPLIACRLPLRISAIAVTPASNGTKCRCAGMVLARAGSLSRMLSELATVPWP